MSNEKGTALTLRLESLAKNGYNRAEGDSTGGFTLGNSAKLRAKLVRDMQSIDDAVVVEAAIRLLALGECGNPPGIYCLLGGKAALRMGNAADSAVLLYRGLKVAQPGTLVWAETLVNRALACCRMGYFPDAIHAGGLFLQNVGNLPSTATAWVPYAHHAIGQAHDRMREYNLAVPHHRQAAEGFSDPVKKANSICNLSYALALSGNPHEAVSALDQVLTEALPVYFQFVAVGTRAIVSHHLGRYADSLRCGEEADILARGHEEEWMVPLAEVHYWMSRSAWELGDRYRSAALALHAAVHAERRWNIALREMAAEWLEEIMARGGIASA